MPKHLAAVSVAIVIGVFAASQTSIGVDAQQTRQSDVSATATRGFVSRSFLANAVPRSGEGHRGPSHTPEPLANSTPASAFDSVAHWSDSFVADGFDPKGNPQSVWPYTMVGRAPESNRTTMIPAPVIPVIVQLLDASGRIVGQDDPRSIVAPTLHSPIFEPFTYTSGTGQFDDQMQRATFWNRFAHVGDDDDHDTSHVGWHTLLAPSVKDARVMRVPSGAWLAAANPDGSCCAFVEIDADVFSSLLFPPTAPVDDTTVIGAAELAGDMTTHDITSFLFHNVVLFGNKDPQKGCCIIGFHSYDSEPGTSHNGNRERRYVMNFSSWIDPGLFLFGFSDITPLSHEMAETFNDPFVDNLTPWWLSVDPLLGSAQCQPVLETGDVVRSAGLADADVLGDAQRPHVSSAERGDAPVVRR